MVDAEDLGPLLRFDIAARRRLRLRFSFLTGGSGSPRTQPCRHAFLLLSFGPRFVSRHFVRIFSACFSALSSAALTAREEVRSRTQPTRLWS